MSLKPLAALALALTLAVAPVAAQDRADLALQAVDLGFLPQVQQQLVDSLWPRTETLIREKLPDADDSKIAELRTTFEGFARDSAQSALVPLGIALARMFDETELTELIAFYSSPVGQKLNAADSEVPKVLGQDVGQRITDQLSAIQVRVENMIAAEGGN